MASADSVAAWIVAALGAGGGGKFFYDLVTMRARGKKIGAEGSAILVGSASEYARQLTEDHAALRGELNRHVTEQRARDARLDRMFREHGRWDMEVYRRLAALQEPVDPPPPLYVE